MAPDLNFVKIHIADQIGVNPEDLARLYNVDPSVIDKKLASLGKTEQAITEKVLADIDAARMEYRILPINDEQASGIQQIVMDYIFHPLVSMPMANGAVGWRLSGDDAQYIAFRSADVVSMDFDWSDVLRMRLNRLIMWPEEAAPDIDEAFCNRVIEVTSYLIELTGVL